MTNKIVLGENSRMREMFPILPESYSGHSLEILEADHISFQKKVGIYLYMLPMSSKTSKC